MVAALILLGLLHGTLWLFRDWTRRRSLSPGLLRAAGRSDARRLEWLTYRCFAAAFSVPALGLIWHAVHQHLLPEDGRTWSLAGLVLVGLIALGANVQELVRFWPTCLRLRHAVAAQAITGQSLNMLMRQEYWVFHDLPFRGHRIHHLVMGRRGVFVVESVWRRPRPRWRRQWPWGWETPSAVVHYDGRCLRMNDHDETAALEQAQVKARALAGPLSAAAGELVTVHAAVAMPGCRVRAMDWSQVIVFNPVAPRLLIEGGRDGARLDPSVARALVRYLKGLDREPVATGPERPAKTARRVA